MKGHNLRIGLITKSPFNLCPPLIRLARALLNDLYNVYIFSLKANSNKTFDLKLIDKINIVEVEPAKGVETRCRPIFEIPRLVKKLLLQENECDVYFVFDPYALEAARQANIYKKAPIIYYSLEIWDEVKFFPQRICENLGRKIISAVIAPQENRLLYLKNKLKISCPGIVFPNTTFDNVMGVPLCESERPSPTGALRFVYIGGLQRGRAIIELIEIFGNIDESVEFVIYGLGSKRFMKKVYRTIETIRFPEKIEFKSFLNYPEHLSQLKNYHIGVMLYQNISLNYRFCAPNKIYEYSMCGLPILASNQPHLRTQIEQYKFGICVNAESKDDIKAGVSWFLSNKDKISTMARNAQRWFAEHGRYDIYYQKVKQLLAKITR